MKIHRSHKIRLKPNNKQANYFARACGVSRVAYNWGLAEWQKQYEAGGKPSAYALDKKFNAIKREEYPFVTEVTKCSAQRAILGLGNAFQNFFRNVKAGKKVGYPKFKKKGIRDSFYISNDKFRFDSKKIKIPKLGWVKMAESLRLEGRIVSATISKIAGNWYIAVQVEQGLPNAAATGSVLGVDVGIKALATVSDGRVFENPRAYSKNEKRLRGLHKAFNRKKKGSNNRKKALLKLQKLYERIANIRKDAIHKATTAITKSCSVIGIEDLNVTGMMKNRKLSKHIQDASFGEVLRQIEYKSERYGVKVVKADRFYPSSKTCSKCGTIDKSLKLSDRAYSCSSCNLSIDRDLNAATNLMNLAVGSTVSACRLGSSGSLTRGCETTYLARISQESSQVL